MEAWLYQMAEGEDWSLDDYRKEVREGKELAQPWDETGRHVHPRGGRMPEPGDLMFLIFVPSRSDDPGLCGVGEITQYGEPRRLRFRALAPTDVLKTTPRWNKTVKELVDSIRSQRQGTMWRLENVQQMAGLFREAFLAEIATRLV